MKLDERATVEAAFRRRRERERDAVLEEAARICESKLTLSGQEYAQMIRALKGERP